MINPPRRQAVSCRRRPFVLGTGDTEARRPRSCDRVYEYGSAAGRDGMAELGYEAGQSAYEQPAGELS